jgi:hypothetical protein
MTCGITAPVKETGEQIEETRTGGCIYIVRQKNEKKLA